MKKLSQRFCFLFLLLLLSTLCAWADDFVDQLDFHYPRYHWADAIATVRDNPQAARLFLKELPALLKTAPDEQQYKTLQFYDRFVRRVLHYAGEGEFPHTWPEAKYSFQETPIDDDPAAIKVDEETQKARDYLNHAALALEVGAYRTSQNWLKRAVVASHKIAWAGGEVPPDLKVLQDRYRLYLMSSSGNGYIYPRSADRVVADQVARQNKDGETLGVMAFVQSARLSFDFALLDRSLPRLDALAEEELKFVAASFRFEREAFQTEYSWPEFKRQQARAWELFPETIGVTDDAFLGALKRRWVADAAQVWLEQLSWYEGQVSKPEMEAVTTAIFLSLEKPGFYWPTVTWALDKAERARLTDRAELAEKYIRLAESLYQQAGMNHTAKDGAFWDLARKERFVPVPSVTHLGLLKTSLIRARAHQLLARGPSLSEAEFKTLGQLSKELESLTDETQVSGGRHAVSVSYNALLAQRDGPEAVDPNVLTETEIASFLSDDPVYLAELLLARGELLEALSSPEIARLEYTRAVQKIEDYLSQGGASPAQAERLRALARPVYEKLAERLLQDGQRERALDVLGRLAQIRTRNVMEEALTGASSGTVAELARKRKSLRRTTAALTETLQETQKSEALTHHEDNKYVSQLLADTRQEFYSTVKDLQQAEPDFNRLAVRPLNFARIQKAIPEDTSVVQYFPAEHTLYIFVASRDNLVVRSVPLPRETLETMLGAAVRELSQFRGQYVAQGDWNHAAVADLKKSLRSLSRVLIEPIQTDLEKRPVIAIIPSGLLSYIPFSTLIIEDTEKPRFLVQDFQLVSVLKAVDLDSLLTQPADRAGHLVGVGNPDGSLQASEVEIATVAKLFPKSQVLTGKEATVAGVRELLAQKPSFVHLATHGRVNSEEPLESYLVMADGRLNLSDITGLELGDPSLVTLSACNTALGQRAGEPGQDLTTLAEAFWFAGGRSLVASLWSVDDDSTAELMSEFYQNLQKGQSKSEALRGAQLELLSRSQTSAPYHWAPFILIGDWR